MARRLAFGGIGDDLTGAMELASLMVRGGVKCRLYLSPKAAAADTDSDAIVFGLRTRVAPRKFAVTAVDRAAEFLESRGVRQIFFKYCATFDSTRFGNIGPCADVIADRLGADFTLFCPAFPEVGRTVYQGHLFGNDVLISDSPKRFDPLTPMREPNLVKVLQPQTQHKVGLVAHPVISQGAKAVAARVKALKAGGVRYAISDAVDEADLEYLAEASLRWPLMTGGSSVAVYYPPLWRKLGWIDRKPYRPNLRQPKGPAVVLAGSCADRTFDQLAHFEKYRPVLFLDMERALAGEDLVAKALAWAAKNLGGGPVAIATSAGPPAVAAIQRKLGRKGAAKFAENILGKIAHGLHHSGIRRFVISGGETSGAVLDALGIQALDVDSFVTPGQSLAVSLGADPVSLYLKSGKLGPVDMLSKVTLAAKRAR